MFKNKYEMRYTCDISFKTTMDDILNTEWKAILKWNLCLYKNGKKKCDVYDTYASTWAKFRTEFPAWANGIYSFDDQIREFNGYCQRPTFEECKADALDYCKQVEALYRLKAAAYQTESVTFEFTA